MKKNGFVFVETIVAIVILASSLLLLYSSFTKVLQSEKTRVYYDDIAYIYRNWYIKKALNNLNIMNVLDSIDSSNNYFLTLGVEYSPLFSGYESEKTYFSQILNDYEVTQMVILKENKVDNLKSCTESCALNKTCTDYENCNEVYTNLNDEFISYLKSIYIDVSCSYVLAIEYLTCDQDGYSNCKNYYSWISV